MSHDVTDHERTPEPWVQKLPTKASNALRRYRISRGLMQRDVAKGFGVSRPMLSQLELGGRTPGKYLRKLIQEVCGIPEGDWWEREALDDSEADPEAVGDDDHEARAADLRKRAAEMLQLADDVERMGATTTSQADPAAEAAPAPAPAEPEPSTGIDSELAALKRAAGLGVR